MTICTAAFWKQISQNGSSREVFCKAPSAVRFNYIFLTIAANDCVERFEYINFYHDVIWDYYWGKSFIAKTALDLNITASNKNEYLSHIKHLMGITQEAYVFNLEYISLHKSSWYYVSYPLNIANTYVATHTNTFFEKWRICIGLDGSLAVTSPGFSKRSAFEEKM